MTRAFEKASMEASKLLGVFGAGIESGRVNAFLDHPLSSGDMPALVICCGRRDQYPIGSAGLSPLGARTELQKFLRGVDAS